MLEVAVRAEHLALRYLGKNSVLGPAAYDRVRNGQIFFSRVAVMEMQELGCTFATALALLCRFEVEPPLLDFVASASMPLKLASRILSVPAAPGHVELVARPRAVAHTDRALA